MAGDMTILSHRNTRLQRSLIIVCLCLVTLLIWPLRCGGLWCEQSERTSIAVAAPTSPRRPDRELVVAKLKHEDTEWIGEYLPDWSRSIYVVDDPNAELSVPINKGREAMVYLTCANPPKPVPRQPPALT